MTRSALLVTMALCVAVSAQTAVPRTITPTEAESHLAQRVEPIAPPLARAAKIGGTVKLHITISASGEVSMVKVLSGHPMLVQSAVDTVKKWKYKPFMEHDQAIAVQTDVDLFFPGGMSNEEGAARDKYFRLERECRSVLDSRNYGDAERKCGEAVEASNALPKDAGFEHSIPRTLLAHSILLQGRVAEAVPLYEEALAIAKGHLKDNDADLATDYANLGRAYARLGELAKADDLYATSVSTFEAAIQNLPSMKDNYTARLKRMLNEYAQVKEARGQHEAADQLRKKAASL